MPKIELTPTQRKAHRAEAHHLDPVVMIGGDGLTPAVHKEADQALNAHGLIKIRVLEGDRAARDAMFQQLADELNAAPIQHIGKLLVLWRPKPKKERGAPDDDRADILRADRPAGAGLLEPRLRGKQRCSRLVIFAGRDRSVGDERARAAHVGFGLAELCLRVGDPRILAFGRDLARLLRLRRIGERCFLCRDIGLGLRDARAVRSLFVVHAAAHPA